MINVGSMFASYTLDTKGFSMGVKSISRGFSTMRRGIDRARKQLFSLKGALVGLGLGLVAKSFITAAATAEGYRVRLRYLLGSVEEGNRLFAEMAEYAGRVPFEYEKVMESATALSGVMNGGVDEIKEWMPMIGDLAAVTGLSIEQTTSQVIRMYSAGAASADMFRERGVLAMMGFQAGVSYSAEETRRMMMESWNKMGSQFKGATSGLANTWKGLMSMYGDAWFQFRNLVMEAGVFDFMKAGARMFLDHLKKLKEEGRLDEWAKNMADSVVNSFYYIGVGVARISDAFRGWKMIWEGLKGGFAIFASFITASLRLILIPIKEVMTLLEKIGLQGEGSGEMWKGVLDTVTESNKYWNEVLVESDQNLAKLVEQVPNVEKFKSVFEKLATVAESFGKKKIVPEMRYNLGDMYYFTPDATVEAEKARLEWFVSSRKKEYVIGKLWMTRGLEVQKDVADYSFKIDQNQIINHLKAMETIKEFAEGYHLFRKKQLGKLIEKFRAANITETDIERWKTEELKKYQQESLQFRLEHATSYAEALRTALELEVMDFQSAYQKMAGFVLESFGAMEKTTGDFFYDSFTGQLKSAKEYFREFTLSITRAWTDMLSQMLVEWMKKRVLMGMIGGLRGLFGIGATVTTAEYGAMIGGYHTGGTIGKDVPSFTRMVSPAAFAGAKRYHTGLKGDEFPAILQRGETVTPKGESAGGDNYNIFITAIDAQSFAELARRTPEAIIGPFVEQVNSNNPALRSAIKTAMG